MATLVLNDAKVYYGQFDISGDLNTVNLEYGANALDKTTFGQTTKIHQGGLKTADFTMGGLMQEAADAVGKTIFDKVGTNDVVLSVVPQGSTYGNVAYFLKSLTSAFTPGSGQVGDLYAFNASATASGHQPLVRGRLEHASAARTTSGTSTGSQLGALSATQRIYCALHVIAASGTTPTLDVVLQSDDNSGFTSATSRIAMTQATATTYELKSLAGAVTDDYWRLSYTIGGTTPSFTFVVVIGIL
jgi:hypothetical protein